MFGRLPVPGVIWLGPSLSAGSLPARLCFVRPPPPPSRGGCPRGRLRRCDPSPAAWHTGAYPRRRRPAARKAGSFASLRSPACRLPAISATRSSASGGVRYRSWSPGRAPTTRAAWLGQHLSTRPSGLVWPACPTLAGSPAPQQPSARRPGPEDSIPPPAPRWGGCGSPSLGRCALVAALPRLRLTAPGGEMPPAEDAPASLPAPVPSWPASCLSSPRDSCPRLVAGPGSLTSPHGSRALRRPARRPPGSASSTSRACAVQLRSLALVAAHRSWVALRPLRASRHRSRGCASYAATPPPSGTPLPSWGPCQRCPLRSLHAPPPLLRCGALRWPAPCGPGHPWQDGQGSIPARRSAPSR